MWTAYEQAKWFGDDRAVEHEIRSVDLSKPVEGAAFVVRRAGPGRPAFERACACRKPVRRC